MTKTLFINSTSVLCSSDELFEAASNYIPELTSLESKVAKYFEMDSLSHVRVNTKCKEVSLCWLEKDTRGGFALRLRFNEDDMICQVITKNHTESHHNLRLALCDLDVTIFFYEEL